MQELNLSLNLDGCPHACAHHWVGDIGLQGTTLRQPGQSDGTREAYEIYLRGGLGANAAIGRPILHRVPADEVHLYVERLVQAYLAGRQNGESIQSFFSHHSDEELVVIAGGETRT
jgi:ferredoxin-nitrite reductase